LDAGQYSVTEPNSLGYAQTASAGCTGTLANGGTATCTITNDDQAATLIVKKHVVNDNSGTAAASAFTLSVNGGTGFPGDENGTTVSAAPASYSASETGGPSGYTQTASSGCSGTIAAGQTITCTITNDDKAATLTVVKHVINNNGGTATASQFTLSVNGGAGFPGSESGTQVTLNAGAYTVAETGGPSGYTQTASAGCSGTLALGGSATCTITNDDQAATLTVVKHVINDNGGTKQAPDFTLNVTGGSPSPASFPGSETGTTVTLNAGSYSVTEPSHAGYSVAFGSSCT